MIRDVRVCLIEDFEILIGQQQSPPSSQDGGPLDELPSRRDEEDDDVPFVAVAATTGAI
jgi:hypothetical protein